MDNKMHHFLYVVQGLSVCVFGLYFQVPNFVINANSWNKNPTYYGEMYFVICCPQNPHFGLALTYLSSVVDRQ